MGSSRELVKSNARRKGWNAVGFGAITVATTGAAISLGLPVMAGIAIVAGGIATAEKTYQWLKYRGTWGMRF